MLVACGKGRLWMGRERRERVVGWTGMVDRWVKSVSFPYKRASDGRLGCIGLACFDA